MVTALKNDPDLAHAHYKILPQILFQIIYVATGCDYTSFFSEIGKATFLGDTPGTLANTELEGDKYYSVLQKALIRVSIPLPRSSLYQFQGQVLIS